MFLAFGCYCHTSLERRAHAFPSQNDAVTQLPYLLATLISKLISHCRAATTEAGFRLVRLAERMLPVRVLSLVLWPAAALWALIEAKKHRNAMAAWSQFPPAWQPRRGLFFLRQTLGFSHAQFVFLWPDQLPRARWIKRCRLQGNFDLEEFRTPQRPIVFISMHFGPFELLGYWLRAHGIPVTTLVGRPISANFARLLALSAPVHVPGAVTLTDMRRLRDAVGRKGRVLIFGDVDRGKQIQVPFEGHSFRMATGPIRLAAVTGAELIPCLIVETVPWEFVIHFGSPVPQRYLGRTLDAKAAARHLLEEGLPVLNRYPSQSRHRFLSCITPEKDGRSQSGTGWS